MRLIVVLLFPLMVHSQQWFFHIDSTSSFPASLTDSLPNKHVFLLGELHGTNQCPDVTAALLRLLASKGKPVILALEIPVNEKPYIDGFIQRGDTNLLKRTTFFHNTNDGRTSEAMVRLLVQAYKSKIKVICMSASKKISEAALDSLMAAQVLKGTNPAEPGYVIVLAANFHTRLNSDAGKHVPMGKLLKDHFGDQLLSLNFRFQRGGVYSKGSDRNSSILKEDNSHYRFYLEREGFVLIDNGFASLGYDGIIYLKQATPSPLFIK